MTVCLVLLLFPNDVTVPNGNLSDLVRTNPTIFTATFTPNANTFAPNNVITVAGSGYTDSAGNAGTTGTSPNFAINTDNTAPTVTIEDNDLDNSVVVGTTLNYTVTFSEDIQDGTLTRENFDNAGAASVTIGNITETTPGVFSVQVTPTTTGTLQLRIPTGAVISDLAGNNLAVPVQDNDTLTVNPVPDTTPPTVTSIEDGDADNTVTYTVTFSEDIQDGTLTRENFDNAGTASVTIGTITETTPGVFTVQVTPTTTGTLQLRIPTGAIISDLAGNNLAVPVLDNETITVNPFSLELIHITDQEPLQAGAGFSDITNASAIINALRNQDLGNDGLIDNTLLLSSGDAIIPGLFFSASAAVFGSAGIADIQIQNELGVQAIAFGNHEFDNGSGVIAALINGSAPGNFSALRGTALDGQDFTGTAFPYLSANLNFTNDPFLGPLAVQGGQAPQRNTVTSSVVINVNGEDIGVVGATTPTLARISSPNAGLGISPSPFDSNPTSAQLDALAAEIQEEVNALLAADPDLNKVILLSHFQRLDIERAVAARLVNVDIIVGGGSNTRLFDNNDRVRAGDSNQGQYPEFITNAGGTQTALVNTDGSYKYVGRLVLDFDGAGNIIPGSYDPVISGAYATDAQGVAALNAAGLVDPEIQAIVDAIETRVLVGEGNVFGISDVYLNGLRSGTGTADNPDGVRTQETNLGNLTADANLAIAKESDPTVVVSIKNGGGIRASIGKIVVPPGGSAAERLPNSALLDSNGNEVKPEGGISQNDIQTTLAFNNGLTLLTLTKTQLVAVLEHGIGALPSVAGQFPQVAGVKFSFNPTLPSGDRIINAGIFDEEDNLVAELVRNGEVAGNPDETFRIVTLNFLAGGGDGYPFPRGAAVNRVDLFDLDGNGVADQITAGDATFAFNGTEQDALAEYLLDTFRTIDTAFDEADTGPELDERIQNLSFRSDAVFGGFNGVIPTVPNADFSYNNSTVPAQTIGGGTFARVTGTTGADTVNIARGGRAILGGFNDPGDVVNLQANRSEFQVSFAGLTVRFQIAGQEVLSLPVTAQPIPIVFSDGSALLGIDAQGIRIGGQTITETPTDLNPPQFNSSQTSVAAFSPSSAPVRFVPSINLLLTYGEELPPQTISNGTFAFVFGTPGVDTINIANGGRANLTGFDDSGDIVNLQGDTTNFEVFRNDRNVTLRTGGQDVLITNPGANLVFGNGSAELTLETDSRGNDLIRLGGQVITSSPTSLNPLQLNTALQSDSIFAIV